MNGNYCSESKNVEVLIDQTGQNTKNELFSHKRVTHIIYYEQVDIAGKTQR